MAVHISAIKYRVVLVYTCYSEMINSTVISLIKMSSWK